MSEIRIVDVTDEAAFGLLPPCSDPSFDHRTCDYWEEADRGSKAHRASWLAGAGGEPRSRGGPIVNPFAVTEEPALNPFVPSTAGTSNPFVPPPRGPSLNPFAVDADVPPENPFAPRRPARPTVAATAPRKLQMLGRGLAVFGSYAKVLLEDGEPAAYCQFGPLSAYPRASRLRELYPQLPDSPLPAVVTCIAATPVARGRGLAARLVTAVCADLASRGFAAVEVYPEVHARSDATSAADPAFWLRAGFRLAVDDERFPVLRREL